MRRIVEKVVNDWIYNYILCLHVGLLILFRSVSQGAFTFRGSMIDMPLLRQAQNIVEIQNNVKIV